MRPRVSFIVPCYKLAHLLRECVESILVQTYRDFEVLIMDDDSPDNTPEVARQLAQRDLRVKHIRNVPNLGHLANYNRGISLAQGEFVWIISADDRLRRAHVLEHYMRVMEGNPRVGFAFCPGFAFVKGQERELLRYSWHGQSDRVFGGHAFLKKLLRGNSVLAASGLVRKQCYDKVTTFPLDMPYAGDWYLWCAFALHYDVAYFAEPMVNYRLHGESMTEALRKKNQSILLADEIRVLQRIKSEAESAKVSPDLLRDCRIAIALRYANEIELSPEASSGECLSLADFEQSVSNLNLPSREQSFIRARAFAHLGDRQHWHGEFREAERSYRRALASSAFFLSVWIKYLLLKTGSLGIRARQTLGDWCFHTHDTKSSVEASPQ